jgi:hypothetical protein
MLTKVPARAAGQQHSTRSQFSLLSGTAPRSGGTLLPTFANAGARLSHDLKRDGSELPRVEGRVIGCHELHA